MEKIPPINDAITLTRANAVWMVIGTLAVVGIGFGCYKYGKKKAEEAAKEKYEDKMRIVESRVNNLEARIKSGNYE